MEESMEKLLKELLQKKLHGTLTQDEELILSDLVERKRGGGDISSGFRSPDLGGFNKLINDTDALGSTLDEMANKIRNRAGQSQAKQTMAEEDRKKKD